MPRPTEFYHGTSLEAILAIQDGGGFRVDLSGSNAGASLGPGVYITTTLEKALNYAKGDPNRPHTLNPAQGGVFQLQVDLGRCYEVKPNDPNKQRWAEDGYDSAWAQVGIIGQREENCVRDPSRVKITNVVLGHTGDAESLGYVVTDGKLYYKLDPRGVPAVRAQLCPDGQSPPFGGVLLVDHPHPACNGVFREAGLHGPYPKLQNQSGVQMYRHWERERGVWCINEIPGAPELDAPDGQPADLHLRSYSAPTEGAIPIGATAWQVVSSGGDGGETVAVHSCVTTLLNSDDPMMTLLEECFQKVNAQAIYVAALEFNFRFYLFPDKSQNSC